jgi:hypothetical protein
VGFVDLKKRVREKEKKKKIAAPYSPSVLNRNGNHLASAMKRCNHVVPS